VYFIVKRSTFESMVWMFFGSRCRVTWRLVIVGVLYGTEFNILGPWHGFFRFGVKSHTAEADPKPQTLNPKP